MRNRSVLALALSLGSINAFAHAQTAPLPPRVHGIAWDSLRNAPLSGAFVVVSGTSKSAISDMHGRFQFDSLAPGKYALTLQHDVLDSLGLSGVSARFAVSGASDTVAIGIPSFATLWRGACGPGKAPSDSGFLYGSVRDARRDGPVSGVTVAVSWLDVGFDKKTGVTQQWVGGKVRTDSAGAYVICGIPNGVGVQVRATNDSASSGRIEVLMNALRIHRLDVVMGATVETDSTRRGAIAGMLRGSTGQPVADARVVADGVPEVRSDRNGRFVLRAVPVGTRQLEVVAIGMQPVTTTVDVVTRDTANVTLELVKVTALAAVNVTALSIRERRKADYEEHKKLGIGRFLDSTLIEKRNSIVGALMEAPQLKRDGKGGISFGGCKPIIWIDRQISDQYSLELMSLNTIAAMEIYPRSFMIPPEFWPAKGMPGCVIAVWTKMYFP